MPAKENQLVEVIRSSELDETKSQSLMAGFNGLYTEANQLARESKHIVVTDESDVEGMQKARAQRLALKRIRVDAENTRKSLKEQIVREGKAIDGVANILKALIVPVEEYLEEQELFAERAAARRAEEVYQDRLAKLSPLTKDVTLYSVRGMTDEQFEMLYQELSEKAEADRLRAEQAEKDRIAAEKAAEVERKRVEEENKKLRAEAEEREKALAKEREENEKKLAAERAEQEKVLAKERAEREAERKALEEKAAAEREAREKIERERREKEEAEERARAAEEAAAREKELAPDRLKIGMFADSLKAISWTGVKSKKAQAIVSYAEKKLLELSQEIREMANKL